MPWKNVGTALPDRVHFSLQDDWDAAVRRVWLEAATASGGWSSGKTERLQSSSLLVAFGNTVTTALYNAFH